MITRVAATGLLFFSAACSVPQRFDRPTATSGDPAAVRAPIADDTWPPDAHPVEVRPTGLSPTGPAGASLSPPAAQQQYTPHSMFMEAHGEYMLKKEPWRPDVRVSFLNMSDAEVKGEAGDFDLRHGKADVASKAYMDENTFVNFGLQYSQRFYQFSSGAAGAHDETVYRVSSDLGVGYFLDGKEGNTLIELNFSPGLWSDFSGTLHHGDWQFYGRGLLTWRYSDNLYLNVGAEYSGLFRDLDVYPVAGLSWLIGNGWRADILLPRRAHLTYDYDASTAFYIGLDLGGGEFEIRAPTAALNPGISRTINVQELELGVGVQHRFNNALSAFGRVGTTLIGDYHFRSNNATAEYDGTLEPQMFAEFGIGWTF